MIKMPWAEPLERGLKPYQGIVAFALVGVIVATLVILIKGSSIEKTVWLVWLISP